jgi:hypothetical protein
MEKDHRNHHHHYHDKKHKTEYRNSFGVTPCRCCCFISTWIAILLVCVSVCSVMICGRSDVRCHYKIFGFLPVTRAPRSLHKDASQHSIHIESTWKNIREDVAAIKNDETEQRRFYVEEYTGERYIPGSFTFGISNDDIRMRLSSANDDFTKQQLNAIQNILHQRINDRTDERRKNPDGGTHRDSTDDSMCSTECACGKGGISEYGRYCGFNYMGCDGYKPCDAIDYCCMMHDMCVSKFGYTSCDCTVALAKCAACTMYTRNLRIETLDDVIANDGEWNCRWSDKVASLVLTDILYILPKCFNRAEIEALSAAVDFNCTR